MASSLDPLSLAELHAMVTFRWHVASGGASHPFTDKAIEAIFEATSGMPRESNILADNSLLLAFHKRTAEIGPDIVRQVATDRVENLSRREAER